MTSPLDPEALFVDIWKDLDNSMLALEEGGNIDMTNLDRKVRFFCDTVTKLEPSQAKRYDNKIADIVAHLTKIVDKLTERKNAVGEKIDMSNQRGRAQAAYGATMLQNSEV